MYVYELDVNIPAHTGGGQKRLCSVFLFPSPPYPFETGSHAEPGVYILFFHQDGGQQTPRIFLHLAPQPSPVLGSQEHLAIAGFFMGPNSCLHSYVVSAPSH